MISFPRRAAAVCALGVTAGAFTAPAFADDIEIGEDLPSAVTGIAWDARTEEALVVDESGTITAVDAALVSSRPITFAGTPDSVQALSVFDDLLYIADTGDEDSTRNFVTVFRIDPASEITNYRAWDFSYPGGAENARAMAVSGKGRIYIVTDGDDPGIYMASLQPSRTEINRLSRAADAPAGVTDAVFLADGSTLVLRTTTGVELLDGFTWESKAATIYVDGAEGESITTFGDGRMLVGDGTLLRDEALPEGTTTVTPAAAAKTTPLPTPSESRDVLPASTETAVAEDPEPEGVSRRGTLLALLGAGIVAVLAGVVVFVVRD